MRPLVQKDSTELFSVVLDAASLDGACEFVDPTEPFKKIYGLAGCDADASLPSRSAIWPFLEKSTDSPRIRAASCGAWNPVEFSASTKSR
jgi:hypothetical protein